MSSHAIAIEAFILAIIPIYQRYFFSHGPLGSPNRGSIWTDTLSRRFVTSGNRVTNLPGLSVCDLELIMPETNR